MAIETERVEKARQLEVLIRECPGQYLWGYNRYKQPKGAPENTARSAAQSK